MSRDIEAGRAVLRLVTDDTDLQDKFAALQGRVQTTAQNVLKAGLAVGAIGTAITAPLAIATRHFKNVGVELASMSERTGIAVEAISALKYAADQSETSLTAVETAIRKMQVTIASAREGVDSAEQALRRLGITLRELEGLPPEQQFERVAKALREIADPAERARAAVAIFGKAGADVLPLANDLESLTAEVRKLGVVMSEETARQAQELDSALGKLKAVTSSVSTTIGAQLTPALLKLLPVVTNVVNKFNSFIAQHPKITLAAGAIGLSFTSVGSALPIVAAGLGIVNTSMNLCAAAGTTLGVVLGTVSFYFAAFVAGFALVAGLIYLVTGRFAGFGAALDDVTGKVKKHTTESQQELQKTSDFQRQYNADMARLYKEDADNKLEAARERDQKILDEIASHNRQVISQESEFIEERARQHRKGLEKFSEENTRNLKEAEELQAKIFAKLQPRTAGRLDRERKIAAENAELDRQLKLLQRADQLQQNDKIRGILNRADAATSKLAAGRVPTAAEGRALAFAQGDDRLVRNQLAELVKHTTALNELLQVVRDNPGGFAMGND